VIYAGWSTKSSGGPKSASRPAISAPEALPLNKSTSIEFSLATKVGGTVAPDSVILYAYRPSDANADFSLPMQAMGNGLYQVEVTFALKGVWDLLVSVQKDGEEYNEPLRVVVAVGE
jgi:nitrogen fixation protein FixH